MAQFERLMAPSEQDVAGRLKSCIADVQDNPQQVVKRVTSPQVVKCCVDVRTKRMCLYVGVVCLAAAGFSKAQRADQTSHYQQSAADRERDTTSQTVGLQQGYIIMFLYLSEMMQ